MKKNKRLMIVAIPLIVVLFAFVFYDYVYLDVRSEISSIRDEQVLKMRTLQKYILLISQKQDYEKQLAEVKEQAKAQTARFVPGDPVSIASANLQAMVKGIVVERGGVITSERIGKPEDLEKKPAQQPVAPAAPAAPAVKGQIIKKEALVAASPRLQILSVSIDATVPDIGVLTDILYSIETRTPDLVIKELDVRVRNFREPRELLVKIDVIGLYEGK
jgi:hypothetical protein